MNSMNNKPHMSSILPRLFPNIVALLLTLLFCLIASSPAFGESAGSKGTTSDNATEGKIKYRPIKTQFIAALGDPEANSGVGAETWGYWHRDPGPTGVWLRLFPVLKATGGYAPGNWKFDEKDWWLDENGLIMEKPVFEIEPGMYVVTGEREVTTTLTVHEKDNNGVQAWELADNAKLHDVTHMPCRSARYTPLDSKTDCSPSNVDRSLFKIAPGSIMPDVPGCHRLDYSVLIVIGRVDQVASR